MKPFFCEVHFLVPSTVGHGSYEIKFTLVCSAISMIENVWNCDQER